MATSSEDDGAGQASSRAVPGAAVPDEQPGAPARPATPVIRKTPFIAYTLTGIIAIYVLVGPTSVKEFLVATVVAGLVFTVGYVSWLELRR